MKSLRSCLQPLAGKPIQDILHVQPSSGEVLDWAIERRVPRITLAGVGIPSRRGLRRSAAKHRGVELIDSAVSSHAGTASWWRFNVETLNGWLEPAASPKYYPRLHVTDKEELPAEDLPSLISRINFGQSAQESTLLVLELPGNEAQILSALSTRQLQAFGFILVRSVQAGVYANAEPPETVLKRVQSLCYKLEAQDLSNPVWPVRLFRFDAQAAEREGLREQIKLLTAQLREREEAIAMAAKELEGMRVQVESLKRDKAGLERVARERQTWLDEQSAQWRSMESERQEAAQRQKLLQEELVRAEAQIDFIKDLMRSPPR